MTKRKKNLPLLDTEISRRTFLKWTGAVGGAAALSTSLLDYNPDFIPVEAAAGPNVTDAISTGLPYGADKIVPTICTCGDVCGMLHMGQAYVKGGKIVYYEGCPDAWNRGALCARGSTGLEIINHPDRVKYPMLRTNEKGVKGEFKRISWDEAYDRITDAMAEAITQEGPHTVSTGAGHMGNMFSSVAETRMVSLFNLDGSAAGPNGCYSDLAAGPTYTLGDYYHCLEHDPYHSKLIISWGENDVIAKPQEWADMYYKAKQEYGAKIVHIEPRKSGSAEKADLYIPVRPGADAYVALAMANVIIEEDLIDKDFIANHTYGYEDFKELVKKYTPEVVEEVAWAPADRVRTAARWYATMKPAMILIGRGGNQTGGNNSHSGWMMSRAITCLIGLCGQAGMTGAAFSMEASGGTADGLMFHWPIQYAMLGVAAAPLISRTMPKPRGIWETAEIIYNQTPYAYRFHLIRWNPAASCSDQAAAEKGYSKIPMVVVLNRLMHWTASRCGDIILPISSWAEQVVWRLDWEAMAFSAPAIEPMFESKSDHQIYKELSRKLAQKLNLSVTPQQVWPWETDEDFANLFIQHPLLKAEYQKRIAQGYTEFEEYLDLDYQKAVAHPKAIFGPFYANLPDFVPYKAKLYPDVAPAGTDPEEVFFPTYNGDRPECVGKLLFKADWLAEELGLPTLPIPDEPNDPYYKNGNPIESGNFELSDAVKNGYQFVTVGKGHRHWQFLSFNQNYDGGPASTLLREAHETAAEPCVEMNPRDAKRLGLKHGDYVTIESQYGKMEHIKLLLSEAIMPKTIVPPYHWGNVQNRIYPNSASFGSMDPDLRMKLNPRTVGEWGGPLPPILMVGGQANQSAALCKVYKA